MPKKKSRPGIRTAEGSKRRRLFFLRRLASFGLFKGGLSCGQAGDGNAEGRAAHIGQADAMTELNTLRVSAVFAADPQFDVRPGLSSQLNGQLHESADIKLGICGEHGGDPESVKFCHRIGLSYVSCSPFRVPIARLAAAQAALEELKAGQPAKKK